MIQPKSTLTQQHYDCLDGLRAVLALYVVIHHAWLGVYVHEPAKVSYYFLPLAFGRFAVCFFIILSGFCLMLPTLKNDFTLANGVWHFIKRRAWRILPPYYFALVLSIITDLPVNDMMEAGWNIILPVKTHNVITHLLLVQNFVQHDFYKINGALWSIAVEWQIYFLFPLLLMGWRILGPFYATAAAILSSLWLENQIIRHTFQQPCSHFIGLFTMGMLAAHVCTSSRYALVPWRFLAVIPLAAFVVVHRYSSDQSLVDVIFGILATNVIIIIFFYPTGWLHRGLNWRPLVFIGSFAYSIYLIHGPIMQIMWLCTFSSLETSPNVWCLILIFLGSPIAVAVSYLFFLLCEKPFLQIKERKVIHVK